MATEPAKAIGPLPLSDQPASATTATRYHVLVLLVLINVLSYVDRHMLPAFAAQITAELGLSRQQFGYGIFPMVGIESLATNFL